MYPSRYASPWHPPSQVHLFPHNPYPQPLPPPQPIAHKVWIIDCKSCGTFLTNRGMKAVLLLHPDVALFSSDALPVNCSAYSSNPDVLRPTTSCRPPARTCECLTQTLCCHGCGAAIGYMIVIPCIRCTSSITATNRATNGHRFVFHSSEVSGSERHYIPDEPGVIPFDSAWVPSSPPTDFSSSFEQPSSLFSYEEYTPPAHSEYLPTPPVDLADLSPVSSTMSSPTAVSFSFPFPGPTSIQPRYPSSPPPLVPASPPSDDSIRQFMYRHSTNLLSLSTSSEMSPPPPPVLPNPMPYGMPSEPLEASNKLKAGDVLYWHHLIRHGEIPGVANDPRARRSPSRPVGYTTQPPKFLFNR
ncbi:hypothetical protein E1B28_000564 [Marasmius oreades]|uniref:Uncharacterized protein n=1 Tax=Marasmius oreades TaxID=181124 RepID=A0A9P7V1K6_9AGAR|nr:uncharacterized protein E1B28_000564 [Marasmius oreades]KAG7098648.1 hypothetical protein E1B28_000564 [Marasmius oreades]